jgi:hypothetical protein
MRVCRGGRALFRCGAILPHDRRLEDNATGPLLVGVPIRAPEVPFRLGEAVLLPGIGRRGVCLRLKNERFAGIHRGEPGARQRRHDAEDGKGDQTVEHGRLLLGWYRLLVARLDYLEKACLSSRACSAKWPRRCVVCGRAGAGTVAWQRALVIRLAVPAAREPRALGTPREARRRCAGREERDGERDGWASALSAR